MLKSMKLMPAFFYFNAESFPTIAAEALRKTAPLFECHIAYNAALAEKTKRRVM
jgi:hypothetical protein